MSQRDIGREILDGLREIKAHQRGEVALRTFAVSKPQGEIVLAVVPVAEVAETIGSSPVGG